MQEKFPILILFAAELLDLSGASRNEHHVSELVDQNLSGEAQLRAESSPVTSEMFSITEDNLDEVTFSFQAPAVHSTNEMTADIVPVQTETAVKLTAMVPKGLVRYPGGVYQLHKEAAALKLQGGDVFPSRLLSSTNIPISRQGLQSATHQEQPKKTLPGKPERDNNTEPSIRPASTGAGLLQPVHSGGAHQDSLEFAAVFSIPALKQTEMPNPKTSLLTSAVNLHSKEIGSPFPARVKMALESARVDWLPTLTPPTSKRPKDTNPEAQPDTKAGVSPASLKKTQMVDARVEISAFFQKPASGNLDAVYSRMMQSTAVQFSPTLSLKEEPTDSKARNSVAEVKDSKPPSQLAALQTLPQGNVHSSLLIPLETLVHDDLMQSSTQGPRSTTDRSQSLSLFQTLTCTKHISQETSRSSKSGVLVLQGDANHQTIKSKPETAGSPRSPQTSPSSSLLIQSQMSELKFSQTTREQGVTPAFFPGTSTFLSVGLQPLSTFASVHAGHQLPATSAPVYVGLQLRGISSSAEKRFSIPISSAATSSGFPIQAISAHLGSQETFPMKLQMSTVKDSKGKISLPHQIDKAGSPKLSPQASTTTSPPVLYDNKNQKEVLPGFAPSVSWNQQPVSLESFPPKLALFRAQGRQLNSTAHPEPVLPDGSHEILAHLIQAVVQQFGMLDDVATKNLSDFRVDQLTVLPSSQYLSFLLRNSNGTMCLQPMQDSSLPTGFPNTSIGTLVSIQQMLTASSSSAVDLANLQNLSPSSLILVKPVFILFPTERPGFQVLHSAKGEDEHKTALSFTNKQVRNLITPESSHDISVKTRSSYSSSKPLWPETTLFAISNQSVEKMKVNSRPMLVNTNSTVTTSLFQGVTSASDHLLYPLTRISSTVQAIHPYSLPEGIQLSVPYSRDSEDTDTLLLKGVFAEALTSTVPPLVLSTQLSPSVSPKVFFTAEKPSSSSVTSLLLAKGLPASETPTQPLFTVRRSVNQLQHSMKLMLQTTSLHQGLVTTSSSINTRCTECLNLRSAGTTQQPLKMSTNIMPLQSTSQSVSSMASLQRRPAQVQFAPSTLPAFSALPAGNNLKDSAAGSSAHSGGITAHATVVQTLTTSIKPHLTRRLAFTPIVPKSFMVTERPAVAPIHDPFSTKVQMKTAVSGKLLATITHTRIYASLASSVLTDAPLPSALKHKQTSLAPTKLFSLANMGGNAKPTEISINARKIGTSTLLGTSMSLPAMFDTRTQRLPSAVLGNKIALTLVQPSVSAGSAAFEREPKLTQSTSQSLSAMTFAAKTASLTNKKVYLLPTSAIGPDPYVTLPMVARLNKANVLSPSIGKSDSMLVKEEYSAATGQLPIQAPVFSSHQASASLQSHPLEKIVLEDNAEHEPGHSSPDTVMQATGSSRTKSVSANRLVSKVTYQSPALNAVLVNDAKMLLTPDLTQFLPTPESHSYSQILMALTPERNSLPDVMNSRRSEEPFSNTETEEMFKTNEVTEEADGLVTILTLLDSQSSPLLSESRQRSVLQSDDVLLNGHAVVTDVCGSGNYTVQMSLRPATEASSEVHGPFPSQETYLVLITLQSNSSHPVLQIQSCCVTPMSRPEGPDATCCLFHRLPSECRHIQLLQSSQSKDASFTVQLFQMLNHSVAYLHCELNVCLRGKTGCEQDCFESVEMLPPPTNRNSYGNLHNLISFGPILRMKNRFLYKPVEGPDSAMLVPILLGSLTGFAVLGGVFLSLWLHHRQSTKNLHYPPLGEIQGL